MTLPSAAPSGVGSASTARAPAVAARTLRDLTGPPGWPLLGNTLQLDPPRFHLTLERWARRYGPIYKLRSPGRLAVVISDAAVAETLLRARPQALRRTSNLEPIFAEVGAAGVFSAEGAAWKPQRRLAMDALSARNLAAFFPALHQVAQRLRARWIGSAGRPLAIQDDLMRFTVDVTTALAFGVDLNTLGGGEVELHRHLAHIFPAFARRLLSPVPYWRWFRLPADRRLDRALVELRRIQEQLIGEARARLAAMPDETRQPKNFLEAMILAKDEEGRSFPDEIIYGNTLTMLLAGEDTTANSLAWAVHDLCERPDVVARARTEMEAVLGEHLVPPNLETAGRLPYLDALASEAMRLHPVAPLIGLEANEDVLAGDVMLPRGTWLTLLTRPPAVALENFAEPTEFKPERWLAGEPPAGAHVRGAAIAFGSGPRICPGRQLAMLEMRVVLVTLLASFDIERVGQADDVRERFSFTMFPEGLRVILRPRERRLSDSVRPSS